MRIALATTNLGKVREIQAILNSSGIDWLAREEAESWPEIEETGETFLENARLKARAVAEWLDVPALADDSGLEVEALDGRPGIRSARFAGPSATDPANCQAVGAALRAKGLAGSPARFVAAIVLAWPDGRELTASGFCEGRVVVEPSGQGGFGYDPIFIPAGFNQTLAELGPDRKNEFSHRAQALKALLGRMRQGGLEQ